MSTEDNKALVSRLREEVWNQGNVAVVDELFATNFIYHDPGLPDVRTREDYKRWFTETHNAFPDQHVASEDLIAEGDKVVERWTYSGTNTGDFVTPQPLPATGKHLTTTGINITRLAGGKLVELWSQGDDYGTLVQLGLIPAPGQAS